MISSEYHKFYHWLNTTDLQVKCAMHWVSDRSPDSISLIFLTMNEEIAKDMFRNMRHLIGHSENPKNRIFAINPIFVKESLHNFQGWSLLIFGTLLYHQISIIPLGNKNMIKKEHCCYFIQSVSHKTKICYFCIWFGQKRLKWNCDLLHYT